MQTISTVRIHLQHAGASLGPENVNNLSPKLKTLISVRVHTIYVPKSKQSVEKCKQFGLVLGVMYLLLKM